MLGIGCESLEDVSLPGLVPKSQGDGVEHS